MSSNHLADQQDTFALIPRDGEEVRVPYNIASLFLLIRERLYYEEYIILDQIDYDTLTNVIKFAKKHAKKPQPLIAPRIEVQQCKALFLKWVKNFYKEIDDYDLSKLKKAAVYLQFKILSLICVYEWIARGLTSDQLQQELQ